MKLIKSIKQFKSDVKNYYGTYLLAHQNKWNRRLHVLGQFITICYAIAIFAHLSTLWFLMPSIPFVIYIFAWTGHLYFEKNKPATWSVSPLITKSCDWVMLCDILRGKIPF